MIFSHVCFPFQEKMEEGKKEGSKEEKKKEEVKDEKKEEKEEEASPEIVLKVDMHCEACARKVARALKGFEGVEEVNADSKGSKVVVKGKKADPMKVCERLQKKSGKKVELISPLPKPSEEKKREGEGEEEAKKKEAEEKKEEAPAVVTVVLKVGMHCEACAQVIHKRIRKIQGVESVETDLGNDRVVVKGVIEANKLVEYVYKRTGKQASIVKEEEKKEEDKKEEEKKEEDKKKGEDEDNDQTDIIKRMEYWPSKYFTDFAYAPQIFSDENPNACSVM